MNDSRVNCSGLDEWLAKAGWQRSKLAWTKQKQYLSIYMTFPTNKNLICITFVQCRSNVCDAAPTLYNCYIHVLRFLCCCIFTLMSRVKMSPMSNVWSHEKTHTRDVLTNLRESITDISPYIRLHRLTVNDVLLLESAMLGDLLACDRQISRCDGGVMVLSWRDVMTMV